MPSRVLIWRGLAPLSSATRVDLFSVRTRRLCALGKHRLCDPRPPRDPRTSLASELKTGSPHLPPLLSRSPVSVSLTERCWWILENQLSTNPSPACRKPRGPGARRAGGFSGGQCRGQGLPDWSRRRAFPWASTGPSQRGDYTEQRLRGNCPVRGL